MSARKRRSMTVPTDAKVDIEKKAEAFGDMAITETQKETPVKKEVAKSAPTSDVVTKRDSFTMPIFDYELIEELMTRSGLAGRSLNKGEILRAGILALNGMTDKQFEKAINKVVKVKTGRPGGKVK